MNDVLDEILEGEPRYRILDKNGNILYDELKIEQITPAFQEGTPLNKALFDSIKNDINSRLLTSNKATTAQALGGTNDTTYMTPLKTMQAIENGCKVIVNNVDVTTFGKSYSIDIDSYTNENTLFVEITGYLGSLESTVRWNLKKDSYILGMSFSSDGNNIFREFQNIYISNMYSNVQFKIIADIKNGFAFVFSCDYDTFDNPGDSATFDNLMVVKFCAETFGNLIFQNSSSVSTVLNSKFEIKEYRKI